MSDFAGLEAVIFDMDGVLIDSERVYQGMIRRYFSEQGIAVSDEEFQATAGASDRETQRRFAEWWRRARGEDRSGADIEREVFNGGQGNGVDYHDIMNPGVPETLAALTARGLRLALASSSSKENIADVLEQCGIRDYFGFIVSGEDFHESKPNPAIYLHALEKLELDATACVAIEDSDYGITAAKRAGLPVIVKRETRFSFTQDGADYMIDQIPDLLSLLS